MATKTMTVVRPGTYGTRMLKAGDTLECSGPDARLYSKLGWAEVGRGPASKAADQAEEKPKVRRARRRKKTA